VQKYNLNPLWQVFFEFILQLFLNSLITRFVNTKVFFELGIISGGFGCWNNELGRLNKEFSILNLNIVLQLKPR
jgi:hypothetical protein